MGRIRRYFRAIGNWLTDFFDDQWPNGYGYLQILVNLIFLTGVLTLLLKFPLKITTIGICLIITWTVVLLFYTPLVYPPNSRYSVYPRYGIRIFFGCSFSFYDLLVLARASDDRADAIKQVYDWSHSVCTFIAKSLLTFLLGQIGLLAKSALEPASRSSLNNSVMWLLGTSIGLMVLIEFYLLWRIRRIPAEYTSAITLYSKIRR